MNIFHDNTEKMHCFETFRNNYWQVCGSESVPTIPLLAFMGSYAFGCQDVVQVKVSQYQVILRSKYFLSIFESFCDLCVSVCREDVCFCFYDPWNLQLWNYNLLLEEVFVLLQVFLYDTLVRLPISSLPSIYWQPCSLYLYSCCSQQHERHLQPDVSLLRTQYCKKETTEDFEHKSKEHFIENRLK